MSLIPGTRVGPYTIISLLGAGGMGEVYRARDSKLDRDVALKVLPDLVATDSERLTRFEREAKTLASLNHPHIAHVYGFEQAAGYPALAMELVDGEDLGDRLARGPIPVDEAIALARQIIDGVEAAHEQGIVHRDLKPSNIKVRSDDTVKILDFGLAKALARDDVVVDLSRSPTVTVEGTRAGVILGTAAYMSPEQARGRVVDKRTDIWAFGCVLFEMITGKSAFGGETVSDTVAKVLEREPDWAQLPRMTPARLTQLLRHCLAKDARKRLRDIGDARFELDEPDVVAERVSAKRVGPLGIIIAPALVLAGLVATWLAFAPTRRAPEVDAKFERLTFDGGLAMSPALSRDGRLLAYASDRAQGNNIDIWVEQIGSGTPVRLTDDLADDRDPDFSPDGSQIVFYSDRKNPGVYLVPALGGTARRLIPEGRTPRFSPDGTRLAYWTGQFRGDPAGTATATFVLQLGGGTPVQLAKDFVIARNALWSPDGASLLVLGRPAGTLLNSADFDWWWVPTDGRPPVRSGILDQRDWRSAARGESLSVGRWTIRGALVAVDGSLWWQPLSQTTGRVTGTPIQIALGAGHYDRPAVSDDGQIVVADATAQRVVERVSLNGDNNASPIVLHTDGGAQVRTSQTLDGAVIVYERRSGRRDNIWRKDLRSGQQELVLTVDDQGPLFPVVSPDGSRLAYTLPSSSGQSVTVHGQSYVAETSGGVPRPVCDDCGVYEFLSDNRSIVISRSDRAIALINTMAGTSRDIVTSTDRIERPSVSPDERWTAFRVTVGTVAKVWLVRVPALGQPSVPRDGWQQIDEPTITGRPAGWSSDSSVLYLLLDTDGFRCLWGQRVDRTGRLVGKPFAVRHLHDQNGFGTTLGNAISPEGFLFEGTLLTGNLWRLVH